MTFEKNQGQTSSEVKFLSRGPGYTAFLTTSGLVLSLRPSATVQFTVVGAAMNPLVVGEKPLPGNVNYFIGNDPSKWLTKLPTYAQVRCKNVYPGIDLVYHGNGRQLEYDFEIEPGSDPRRIQFQIQGASQIELGPEGDLILELGTEKIHLQNPAVYQEWKGQRSPVQGRYAMTDATHVAFQVGRYDPDKPLVIDPVLVYSTYWGGSEQPTGIAVDSTGSVYVTGYANSVDFPLARHDELAKNANQVFVAKMDPAGTSLTYADYIGGNGQDYGVGLVLDATHDAYVTGSTTSSNFPVVKAYQPQQPGPYAGFVTKISADGSSLLYSTYLGGGTFDQPSAIALDSLDQAYVAGYTASQNFPVSNAYQSAPAANQAGAYGDYGFLTKFSTDGSSLIYSTYLGGNSVIAQPCGNGPCWPAPYNVVNGLAVDGNGDAHVAGTTNTNNFPTTPGAFLAVNTAQGDAQVGFVTKFTSAGALDSSTYFYQSSGAAVQITAIAVDSTGSAYIAGDAKGDSSVPITSTGICDPRVYARECNHAFVAKFDPTASTLLYSTFLAPNNHAVPQTIALDASGNAYVLASASSPLLPTNEVIGTYSNQAYVLLVEVDPGGTTLLFSTDLGGSGNDFPGGMALDADGSVYVAGATEVPELSLTQGGPEGFVRGNADAFVVKMSHGPRPEIAVGGVALSPDTLTFADTQVGVSSAVQVVTLTNEESSSLDITKVQITGDYAQTDNCPATLPGGASCTFNITFTPTGSGSRNGALAITDSAAGSPQSVALSGTGVDFSLSSSPDSVTINAGATATYTLTVAPSGGPFPNVIQLTCAGVPSDSNCQLSSASVIPGSTSATVTLTVTTVGPSAAAAQLRPALRRPGLALSMTFPGLGLLGVMVGGPKSFRKKVLLSLAAAVLVAALFGLSACAGGTGIGQTSGTSPGTYKISVTGTAGALQHSLPLTLTVQ